MEREKDFATEAALKQIDMVLGHNFDFRDIGILDSL
jgi:hypothetical protein